MIKTPIQIRFNDMDPMGRVNNSSYSGYLEIARMDFCNKYFDIQTLNDTPFVLARIEMDLLKPLSPGKKAEVLTWVSGIKTTSWEFSYLIVEPNSSEIFVRAKSVQVYFNYHTYTKERIPEHVREILSSLFYSEAKLNEMIPRKL
ncbi:MAG: acyl-CoA thioesterase [Leptospiraceae bacterium]|nr:acyl-CoA thioesterase [Leptospiraceae bacterium]MCP5512802.1 acyl-CoA thioesterase [Leptospiraceae bacterium]